MLTRSLIVARALGAVSFALAALPALAGEPPRGAGLWEQLPGPPPADSGKPMLGTPPAVPPAEPDAAGCPSGLPCGTRLLGAVRKNGAVELQVPALRW